MAPPQPRRLLFVSVPLLGHVNPLLEPARLLVQQGQQVLFLTYEQRRANIEQAHIPFQSLGHDSVDKQQQLDPQDPSATKKSRMLAAAALYTGMRLMSSTTDQGAPTPRGLSDRLKNLWSK